MIFPLLAALAAAVCYGVGSVLQAVAARRTGHGGDVDPRLLMRALRQTPFLVGIGFDLLGFACQFYALRTLPLYLVQAALAANLAVTAVIAVPVLGVRLERRQWIAVAAVCGGLAVLGLSAGAESTASVSLALRWWFLGIAVALAIAGLAATRAPQRFRGPLLGVAAGCGFAVMPLAVRALSDLHATALLANPAAYAAAIAGIVGFACYAAGLQQSGVTAVTAAVVVVETAIPAAVGVLVFGDTTRSGFGVVAVVGFVLAVVGALGLARFGDLEHQT
ncbi:EamA family transporter [Hamadaea tsunoensis]|uniref:EamA family transporter n=1 Tax=Hamadaea tsunoensis TaxID=53368 RepID=UPI00048964AC|nr:EamA family transporter [Hamadaea tsunoensis]